MSIKFFGQWPLVLNVTLLEIITTFGMTLLVINLRLLWLMILLFLLTYYLSMLKKLPAQTSYHLDF